MEGFTMTHTEQALNEIRASVNRLRAGDIDDEWIYTEVEKIKNALDRIVLNQQQGGEW